jgi:hypothetical protein
MKQEPTHSVNIGTMVNSALQQGSSGAIQSLSVQAAQEQKSDIGALLAEILAVRDWYRRLDMSAVAPITNWPSGSAPRSRGIATGCPPTTSLKR